MVLKKCHKLFPRFKRWQKVLSTCVLIFFRASGLKRKSQSNANEAERRWYDLWPVNVATCRPIRSWRNAEMAQQQQKQRRSDRWSHRCRTDNEVELLLTLKLRKCHLTPLLFSVVWKQTYIYLDTYKKPCREVQTGTVSGSVWHLSASAFGDKVAQANIAHKYSSTHSF